jgi:hypothetical protein
MKITLGNSTQARRAIFATSLSKPPYVRGFAFAQRSRTQDVLFA